MDYVKVATKSEIPDNKMKKVNVGEKEALIVNVNGNYYAINNRCTHAGTDLSLGTLKGKIIECPKHHAKFDVTSGKVFSKPSIAFFHPNINDEQVYQMKLKNEDIMVKI
jgi:nitrite reductase/ring-hydroxylating ferredoxin subunit